MKREYFIASVLIISLCISGCSIFSKPYSVDFGYTTTTYNVTRSKDTVIKSQAIKNAQFYGKLIDDNDPDKLPFYDFTKINLKNIDGNTTNSANFDLDGAYSIFLEPGTYTISFEANQDSKSYKVVNKDSIISLKQGETRIINYNVHENRIEADGVTVYKNKRAYKKAQRDKSVK